MFITGKTILNCFWGNRKPKLLKIENNAFQKTKIEIQKQDI